LENFDKDRITYEVVDATLRSLSADMSAFAKALPLASSTRGVASGDAEYLNLIALSGVSAVFRASDWVAGWDVVACR
jgi:hypothetical protein